MRKLSIKFLIVLLVFSTFPVNYHAESSDEIIEFNENVILMSEEVEGHIELLDLDSKKVIYELPDESEALLLELIDEEYGLIQYLTENDDEEILIEGLVHMHSIFNEEDAEAYRNHREEEKDTIEVEADSEDDPSVGTIEETPALIEDDSSKSEVSGEGKSSIEKESIEESISLFSSNLVIKESSTSRLGHIRSRNVDIYKDLGGESFKAGSEYTNAVYYIKRQAVVGSETYYLLSTSPSATRGVVGWAKASDLSTHRHVGVDRDPKVLAIKGTGKATTKAWGGNKDTVHSTMKSFKDMVFHVDLTEKVGNNTWYRGKIEGEGQTIWLHSSYLSTMTESATSRLGHIRSGNVDIYKDLGGKSFKAGSEYTNAVYYIKRQAKVGKVTYYLLSTSPSATQGVVGWAKSSDLSTHPHVGVDRKAKSFLIKGNGKATTKAWGGSKDTVYANLTEHKNKVFQVNLTEKVGNNIWYRGLLDGKQVWLHSSYVINANVSSTSRLGHIRSRNVDIYEELGGKSFKAGSEYTNAVYYIKAEARYNNTTYYLLSVSPSATQGVVGWAKASDLSTHAHVGINKKAKTFYVKGNGKATTKAWGGNKDTVIANLSQYKHHSFKVNLTERVGNNTWYRGILDGQQVWLHSSYVVSADVSDTSRLGHIRSRNVDLYKDLGGNSFKAGSEYTNAVYYIKKQARIDKDTYYLLSTSPSSTRGVVGWAKASDLSTYRHVGVDKKSKAYVVKGNGTAYSKAWGGSKDEVYPSLREYEGKIIHINLTEKVGNNTWYRGKFSNDGPTVWIHSSYLTTSHTKKTAYTTSFTNALNVQMTKAPQTDKYRNEIAYVHKSNLKHEKDNKYKVTANSINVREGKNINSHIWGTLLKDTIVTVIEASGDWYQINYGTWRNAKRSDVSNYLEPTNNDIFQHLVLSQYIGASVDDLNRVLKGKGTLNNQGHSFATGAKNNSINEAYLISHAILETGHGTSKLAQGIEVGRDKSGKLVLVTKENRKNLTDIKTTYNMFGIGAIDKDADKYGAIRAYEEKWFTPSKAIVGGAEFVGERYIHNGFKQDTLYKMRWNPASPGYPQYATDIGWAIKQTDNIKSIYDQLNNPTLSFDVPEYR